MGTVAFAHSSLGGALTRGVLRMAHGGCPFGYDRAPSPAERERARSHFAETVRIEDLAAIAGMSVTSFHRHFRSVTSLTPIQYQKQLRLHAARTRLLATREDVSEVGFAVGYDSPSQFSREYRRMFGKPPGQDGADLRSNASSAHAASHIV